MEIVLSMVRDTYVSFQLSSFLFVVKAPKILNVQCEYFKDISMVLLYPSFKARLWTKGLFTAICEIQNVKKVFLILPFLIYKLPKKVNLLKI